MFSSDAQQEENFRIRSDWVVGLPKVTAKFGHREEQQFCAQIVVNEKGGTDARVLSIVLLKYSNLLYPDARDEDGHCVCFKIDGGPGRLNLQMLAELRLQGVYLFPGVQNTTHVTQETDQNYGLFKSQLRKNIQTLMAFQQNAFIQQQQLHEHLPDEHPSPSLPSLNRSHYGILLSGKESSPTLLPAFANAFTKERCLKAWASCGAVPLTRSALSNPSVRHEVSATDDTTPDVSFIASSASDFDWTQATLQELEVQNNNACDNLLKLGLDGEAFRTKAPRAPVSLRNRISADASEEERVKALAEKGFSLQTMFYTVGSTSISADEVFLSAEYKANNERWLKAAAEREELVKQKELEISAKAILEQPNAGTSNFKVPELRKLLKWKLGAEEYQAKKLSKMNKDGLERLWLEHQHKEVADIIVPDISEAPVMPSLAETEIGKAAERNAILTANSAQNLSDTALTNLIASLLKQQEERNNEATINTDTSNEVTTEEAV